MALGLKPARFAKGFTIVFAIAYTSWIAGSCAYIAATPDKRAAFHIGWSLNLTNEAGYVVALLAGLFFGNLLPAAAARLQEAIRPELYIKIAIVILGGFLGITAAEQLGREVGYAREAQKLALGESIADIDRAVIVQADDVTRIRFLRGRSVGCHEGERVGNPGDQLV